MWSSRFVGVLMEHLNPLLIQKRWGAGGGWKHRVQVWCTLISNNAFCRLYERLLTLSSCECRYFIWIHVGVTQTLKAGHVIISICSTWLDLKKTEVSVLKGCHPVLWVKFLSIIVQILYAFGHKIQLTLSVIIYVIVDRSNKSRMFDTSGFYPTKKWKKEHLDNPISLALDISSSYILQLLMLLYYYICPCLIHSIHPMPN